MSKICKIIGTIIKSILLESYQLIFSPKNTETNDTTLQYVGGGGVEEEPKAGILDEPYSVKPLCGVAIPARKAT